MFSKNNFYFLLLLLLSPIQFAYSHIITCDFREERCTRGPTLPSLIVFPVNGNDNGIFYHVFQTQIPVTQHDTSFTINISDTSLQEGNIIRIAELSNNNFILFDYPNEPEKIYHVALRALREANVYQLSLQWQTSSGLTGNLTLPNTIKGNTEYQVEISWQHDDNTVIIGNAYNFPQGSIAITSTNLDDGTTTSVGQSGINFGPEHSAVTRYTGVLDVNFDNSQSQGSISIVQ